MQIDNRSMKLEHSLYGYKVSLGHVVTSRQISWNLHISVKSWQEAKELIEAWHTYQEYPAASIQLDWKGDELVNLPNGGYKKKSEVFEEISEL